MSQNLLKEYRCACGKLLFKGLLLFSVVEVKCKRCGNTVSFGKLAPGEERVSFAVFLDEHGIIFDACQGAVFAGMDREYVLGKHLSELFPLLHDAPEYKNLAMTKRKSEFFEIKDNILLLKDGKKIPCQSSFIFHCGKDKEPQEYRVFNLLSPKHKS